MNKQHLKNTFTVSKHYTHIIISLQSLAFHHSPRVSSSEASDRTLRRRRDIMTEQRKSISGGSEDSQKIVAGRSEGDT